MSASEEDQKHVINLVDQLNAVLAGEGLAGAQTALTIAVTCQIAFISNNLEERLEQARGFTNRLDDFVRREDVAEWIKHSITYLSPTKRREQ